MFVCSLSDGGEVPITVAREDGGEFIARVAVGYEDDTGCVYSTFVAFSPLIGYADVPGFECTFTIIEAQTDSSHERIFWDGEATKALLGSTEDRARIFQVVLASIGILIDEAQPGLVHMVTHASNLPKKALRKYDDACSVFVSKGYDGRPGNPWNGHHIWMMVKP